MERRATDRMPAEVGVSCRVPASPEHAKLVDLSHNGCRLELSRRNVEPGATVNLDFSGRPVAGLVVWVEGEYAGVRFHTALPKPIAVKFGLEPPDPEPQEMGSGHISSVAPGASEGLLRHWVRRLTDAFA